MVGGMAKLGKWFIDSGMRRGTPEKDYERVITVYRDTNSWKQRVLYSEPDAAYLILLDRTGKVAWRYQGAFEQGTFQELTRKVSELIQAR
jgi:predicted transcriptional regulator